MQLNHSTHFVLRAIMRTQVFPFILYVLVAGVFAVQHSEGGEKTSDSSEPQAHFNSLLGGLNAGDASNNAEINAALKDIISSGNWERFTPAPIANADCHVEVQVVQKIPGRCIQLGGHRIPACQTQNWLSFNSDDCE